MSITEKPTGTRTVHGVCHHDCPDTCGWVVDTDERGVAVRLRGDDAHPYSAGELCPKVNRYLDRVYHPDRILTPLRRVGPKGSGEFEAVSWEVALADVGQQLVDLVNTYGGESVLPFSDAGTSRCCHFKASRHGSSITLVQAGCFVTSVDQLLEPACQ